MDLPIETQWPLYDRILQFDRRFETRADDGIVVGVLYQGRFRPSTLARDELMQFASRTSLQLGGRDVRLVAIEVTTLREVELELVERGVDVVYFTPLRGAPLRELAGLSVEHRMVTLTGVREYMDSGVGIGLGLRGGRPEILVNLSSCQAQGVELSSELLKLVTFVTTK